MTSPTDADEPEGPAWVWISSPASRAAGAVSVLAVVETLICVAAYWGYWLYSGGTWQLWLVLLSTPMVLFRSEASVAKSAEWYDDAWDQLDKNVPIWPWHGMIALMSFVLVVSALLWAQPAIISWADWPATKILQSVALAGLFGGTVLSIVSKGYDKLYVPLMFSAMYLGGTWGYALLIDAGLGAVGFLLGVTIGWLPLVVGTIAIGMFAMFLVIRIGSVLTNLSAGLAAVANNWRRFILVNDPWQMPEILPGVPDTNLREVFRDWDWSSDGSTFVTYLKPISNAVLLTVLYLPTYIWRWTIKSTAWFYIPLLWLGWGWVNHKGDELIIWGKSYTTKLLNIAGLILATILLIGSLVALFIPAQYLDLQQTLAKTGAPMTPLGWAFVLDWQAFKQQPWQWFYAPSWALTLVIFFMLDSCRKEIKEGAAPGTRAGQLRLWMWLSNTRYVLTNFGLIVALYAFLTAMGAWKDIATFFGTLSS